MDKQKIENLTASLAVVLLIAMTFMGILFIGDMIFSWDIFPPHIERTIGFGMASSAVIIFASVLVNVMLNLSIIADNTSDIVNQHEQSHTK